MIWLSHPTGNSFVRALLKALSDSALDYRFFTTIAVERELRWNALFPRTLRTQMERRSFSVPQSRIESQAIREAGRLFFSKLPGRPFTTHEKGFFSLDAVYQSLDESVARKLRDSRGAITAVYAYEDGAFHTFAQARTIGTKCFYELPIAYWETSQQLLREEAARYPEWEPTLVATRDSAAKVQRKTEELAMADVVVCPSLFVRDSLPGNIVRSKKCIIAEFGSPEIPIMERNPEPAVDRPLRVLFAGSMTQRKGLADLFRAMHRLHGTNVELIVMGSPVLSMEFYRSQFSNFTYEPPRPHHKVLALMRTCDLLVLPSIVEGRALVQQEAMACGLPLIVTRNAGGEDLIEPGQTGFLIPIRSPKSIAEKIRWFDAHRPQLVEMGLRAQTKAAEYSWSGYGAKIIATLRDSSK